MTSQSRSLIRTVVVTLLVLDLGFVVAYLGLDALHQQNTSLYKVMDLGLEGNFPTWYSASLWLITAVLIALVALEPLGRLAEVRPVRGALAAVALTFTYLSADEGSGLHEDVNGLLHKMHLPSLFKTDFAWITVYAVVGVVLIAVLWPQFRRAYGIWPKATLAIGIGFIMVFTGGVVAEVPGMIAPNAANTGAVATVIEEGLELLGETVMVGGALAIYLWAQTMLHHASPESIE